MPIIHVKLSPEDHRALRVYQAKIAQQTKEFVTRDEAAAHLIVTTLHGKEGGDKSLPEAKEKNPKPGEYDKVILGLLQPIKGGEGDFMTAADIAKLLSEKGVQMTPAQVGLTLKRLGFHRKAKRIEGASKRGFFVVIGKK